MKKTMATLRNVAMTVALLGVVAPAMADSKWVGSGEEFTPDGNTIATYQIEVINKDGVSGTIESIVTITRPGGVQDVIHQEIVTHGNSWAVQSELGKGYGTCYGSDLCENYVQGSNGLDYATTIVNDGTSLRRNVTFVLENGKAVKVLKDRLIKM